MAEYCPLTVVAPLTLLLSYANQNRAQQESQSESFCFFYTRPFVVQNFSRFFKNYLLSVIVSHSATVWRCKKRERTWV